MAEFPVVDVSRLRDESPPASTAAGIDAACRDAGFFYVVGHGVDEDLQLELETLAKEFFALDEVEKAEIAMAHGGAAWRGWFPVGGELTSGRPDHKEGLYFGADLNADDPRPLHGPNLYPRRPDRLREVVRTYVEAMTEVGQLVAGGVALALGLEQNWFAANLTAEPTVLFRIFHYPPAALADDVWGVAEHTDYGLLTLLRQDSTGGLEVHTKRGWTAAPPVPGSFVCNLGDMLERMTGGQYQSTPHRVRNTSRSGRLAFPFFFDPSWDAQLQPVPARPMHEASRWDGASVHDFTGTYGEYLMSKVSKVFPSLGSTVLPSDH